MAKRNMIRRLTTPFTMVVLFAVLIQLLSPLTTLVRAATNASITVNGTDCTLTVATIPASTTTAGQRGSTTTHAISALPKSVVDSIKADASLKADYDHYVATTTGDIHVILFDAVIAGNGSNQTKCRESPSILFSRPSDPKKFFGTYKGNEILLTGTLDPALKTFTFDNTSGDPYAVSGDVANPIFTLDTLNVGFCSTASSAPAYESCMTPFVVDFNTITYRGETYILQSWQGNQSVRMEYVLDIASSPYPARKTGLAACSGLPKFRIDGDNAGKINELTADGDNPIQGFFGQLASLDGMALGVKQTIQYIDYDAQCGTSGEGNIDISGLPNFLKLAQYFQKDNAVAIIPKNPGSGEKPMAQVYVKDATDPTLFVPKDSAAKIKSCAITAQSSTIKFDSDPSTNTSDGTYMSAVWSFPDPDHACGKLGAKILVRFTSSNSTSTLQDVVPVSNTQETAAPVTCNTTWKNPISWILCPVVGLAEDLVDKVESVVAGFLFINLDTFSGNTPDNSNVNGLYNAWNSIRQISTVIIVIIALIMIFSEAMGAGFMSNYSVKKLLPRLVFAGIAIQLSWVFSKELINIANVFGNGIQGLLLAPFGGKVATDLLSLIDPNKLGAGAGAGLSFALIVGGAVSIGAIGTIAIGLIIALIIAFVTLILRYMVIILCVLFAPIAIALSVLPGTQKMSKLWWESFSKALMMYPIIMAMFAAGKIIAFGLMQAGTSQGSQKGWFTLAAIVGYFLPYALLPTALKIGGTALGKVTGAFNDKSKGVFDRAKTWNKGREEKRKKFNQQYKQEQRVNNLASGNALQKRWASNRIRAAQGATGFGAFINPSKREKVGTSMRSVADEAHRQAVKKESLQFAEYSSGGQKDELVRIANNSSESLAKRQAATERLIQMKDTSRLQAIASNPVGNTALKKSMNDGKFGDVKEFAPHLTNGGPISSANDAFTGGVDDNKKPTPEKVASAEAASKWSADSWRLAIGSNNPYINQRAQEIKNDSKLWNTLGGETQAIIDDHLSKNPPMPAPPRPAGGGAGTPAGGGGLPGGPGFGTRP